jgi:hypothetical protein
MTKIKALLCALALSLSACAHFNSPGNVLSCMENPHDEALAMQSLEALLDKDDVAAITALMQTAPDLWRCLLKKAAARKANGGAGDLRSARARRILDES